MWQSKLSTQLSCIVFLVSLVSVLLEGVDNPFAKPLEFTYDIHGDHTPQVSKTGEIIGEHGEHHITDHGNNEGNEGGHVEESCMDLWDQCEPLRVLLGCDDEKYELKKHCKKTCGGCKQHADCSKVKYGCCPDKVTPKQDKVGSTCPVCKDKYPRICEIPTFLRDCNKADWAGKWMTENCKKTCEICVYTPKPTKKPNCFDDAENHMYCGAWKTEGLCKNNKMLMKTYCKKTCNFCDDDQQVFNLQSIGGN